MEQCKEIAESLNPKFKDQEHGENLSMRLANETASFIKENKDLVIERLAKRNIDATKMIDEVIAFDEDRNDFIFWTKNFKQEFNR